MRFLMLNWRDPKNPISGGAERVSSAYLAALVRRGHEVYWFANHFPGAPSTEVVDGITIVRGGGKGTSILKAIGWYRRQEPFDLVIDQHHGIPWYAPWWCRTNCVAYIHEVLGPIWHVFYPRPISTFGQWQERRTHWWYRNVPFWTPSQSTRSVLQRHGVRSVIVIPNGCDTAPLPELESKPLRLPLKLVAVSRLAPNKRIDHVIRAASVLNQRGIETRLTVVGTGEAEGLLCRMVADLNLQNRVIFTGQVPEQQKNEKLRDAHFLVHCSVREGWGLNVIEANALGTPAVVYPVGGLVDSTVHGETGIVTASETPEAVADALGELVGRPDDYPDFRIRAWERSKHFQWSTVLPEACNWLEDQAANRNRL